MTEMSVLIDVEEHMHKNILKWSEENTLETDNDLYYSLGLYLHLEHRCTNPNDFDRLLKFAFLDDVNPSNIYVKKFRWMHQLNSFQSIGINVKYPFKLPYSGSN